MAYWHKLVAAELPSKTKVSKILKNVLKKFQTSRQLSWKRIILHILSAYVEFR
jgi:hypothetical protein